MKRFFKLERSGSFIALAVASLLISTMFVASPHSASAQNLTLSHATAPITSATKQWSVITPSRTT
ncbi:MAG: hypothetical protein QOC87_1731 [Actinomycetota bacterium]|nr:hypothetical protein [Actinomycetota bacterium]